MERNRFKFRCKNIEELKNDKSIIYGDKIIIPSKILKELISCNIVDTLYIFNISNPNSKSNQYCGVLEFCDIDFIYLPLWMMKNISVQQGGFVDITYQYYIKKVLY